MTISESWRKDKRVGIYEEEVGEAPKQSFLRGLSEDWLLLGIILVASGLSFGLGWLAGREMALSGTEELWIETMPLNTEAKEVVPTKKASEPRSQPAAAAEAMPTGGGYVASKSGTKYYLPWCGSVGRIKEENKVWFTTKEEAEAAGYQPASNCKGM